jgi:hypothetical protein
MLDAMMCMCGGREKEKCKRAEIKVEYIRRYQIDGKYHHPRNNQSTQFRSTRIL